MSDYADHVVAVARTMVGPLALCGWSMGGLVLTAAQEMQPHSVVLLEAGGPAEVQGRDPHVQLASGTFDRGRIRGIPAWHRRAARVTPCGAERKRGISIPSLPCPSLVIASADSPDERGRSVADLYGSEFVEFAELRHFDLVQAAGPRQAVADFLGVRL